MTFNMPLLPVFVRSLDFNNGGQNAFPSSKTFGGGIPSMETGVFPPR
jgi:hypothetical protein